MDVLKKLFEGIDGDISSMVCVCGLIVVCSVVWFSFYLLFGVKMNGICWGMLFVRWMWFSRFV